MMTAPCRARCCSSAVLWHRQPLQRITMPCQLVRRRHDSQVLVPIKHDLLLTTPRPQPLHTLTELSGAMHAMLIQVLLLPARLLPAMQRYA